MTTRRGFFGLLAGSVSALALTRLDAVAAPVKAVERRMSPAFMVRQDRLYFCCSRHDLVITWSKDGGFMSWTGDVGVPFAPAVNDLVVIS